MKLVDRIPNEYLSLTALMGDALKVLDDRRFHENGIAFLIPQTEGAEIDGQSNRFVRTKMDEKGYGNVDIISPFTEDALFRSQEEVRPLFLALLARDIIRLAPAIHRKKHLKRLVDIIESKDLEIDDLMEMAEIIRLEFRVMKGGKKILAIGEPLILYNDFLNDFSFMDIENKGHRVIYAPLSEYLWVFWREFLIQNKNEKANIMEEGLDEFREYISVISGCLWGESAFEANLEDLVTMADKTIGYYAGAFGRYREAKILSDLNGIDGIITVASTYENTAISLGILHKGFENSHTKPVLNLTFDGNRNENDRTKIESFIFYL